MKIKGIVKIALHTILIWLVVNFFAIGINKVTGDIHRCTLYVVITPLLILLANLTDIPTRYRFVKLRAILNFLIAFIVFLAILNVLLFPFLPLALLFIRYVCLNRSMRVALLFLLLKLIGKVRVVSELDAKG